jgi:hypothetical protein
MKRKNRESGLVREYSYASHHHLIPLYVLIGLLVVAFLVVVCFVSVLWQNNQREILRADANTAVQAHRSTYLTAAISPAEKKQYVYSASVRFPVDDPYNVFRYSYDPGISRTKTSSIITISTSRTIQQLEAPVLGNPAKAWDYIPDLQQCSRLYVIRFEPGVTPYGGFAPLKDIKLKDGRTAYVHKNTMCVPRSTQAMNDLDAIEKNILAIESY